MPVATAGEDSGRLRDCTTCRGVDKDTMETRERVRKEINPRRGKTGVTYRRTEVEIKKDLELQIILNELQIISNCYNLTQFE